MSNDFKFVHAADLHLDSPLIGLEEFDDAPVETIRDATRQALKKLVELCIDEGVAFLLIAGDVYDGEWKSMTTGRFFADQMARLRNAGIPVFLIKGNHDAASLISRDLIVPGVTTFDHKKPETRVLEELGVAIHGQSYSRRDVTENLAAGYPSPKPGLLNIGMLHTCATGGGTLHAPYAPCTVDELVGKGYDYWALGHVHQRAVLNENPPVVFPGNIQGRHVREPAEEGKGVTLVEVVDGAIGRLTHVALDTVRWMHLVVDVSTASTIDQIFALVGDAARDASNSCRDRLLAVRISINGSCTASLEIHRDLATFESGLRSAVQGSLPDVWIEEIRVSTRSPAVAPLVDDQSSLGDLLEFVRTAEETGRLSEATDRLANLRAKIKTGSPELVEELGLEDGDLLASLLPEVQETIASLALGATK